MDTNTILEKERKVLEAVLLRGDYGAITLADAIGISYNALMRFMRQEGPVQFLTELKIRQFIEKQVRDIE